jgi:hypothetical protein
MSRYEKDLIPKGMKDYNCRAALGWDADLQTFYLQVNEWGEDVSVHLGQTRHEFTNVEIFANAAALAGIELGDAIRRQLVSDQLLSHLSEQPAISNASTSVAAVGDKFDDWVCRSFETFHRT